MAPSGPEACALEPAEDPDSVNYEFQWPLLGLRRAHGQREGRWRHARHPFQWPLLGLRRAHLIFALHTQNVGQSFQWPLLGLRRAHLFIRKRREESEIMFQWPLLGLRRAHLRALASLSQPTARKFQWPLLGLRRAHVKPIERDVSVGGPVSMAPSGPEACALPKKVHGRTWVE